MFISKTGVWRRRVHDVWRAAAEGIISRGYQTSASRNVANNGSVSGVLKTLLFLPQLVETVDSLWQCLSVEYDAVHGALL